MPTNARYVMKDSSLILKNNARNVPLLLDIAKSVLMLKLAPYAKKISFCLKERLVNPVREMVFIKINQMVSVNYAEGIV